MVLFVFFCFFIVIFGSVFSQRSTSKNIEETEQFLQLCTEKRWKVGFVLHGDISDFAWTFAFENARNEFERTTRELGCNVETRMREQVASEDLYKHAKEFLDEGFQILVGNTFDFYTNVVLPLAWEYPNVTFLNPGSFPPQPPNFGKIEFDITDVRFLTGMICGALTKTNKIGFLTPCSANGYAIPLVCSQVNAFEAGAFYMNPKIEIHTVTVENFEERIVSSKAAEILHEAGVDCFTSQEDTLEGEKRFLSYKDTWVVGGTSDLRFKLGEKVASSGVFELRKTFLEIFFKVMNGTRLPDITWLGIGDGTVRLAPFAEGVKDVPGLVMQIEEQKRKMINGTDKKFCGERIRKLSHFPDLLPGEECLTDEQWMVGEIWNKEHLIHLTEQQVIEEKFVSIENSTLGKVTVVVVILLWILDFLVALSVIVYRNTKQYRSSSPFFCLLIILGVALGHTAVFVWLFKPTKFLCNFKLWLASIGFGLVYSAMIFKNYRIMVIFDTKSLTIFKISNSDLLLKGVLPFLSLEVIILILFLVLDPLEVSTITSEQVSYLQPEQVELRCIADAFWAWILLIGVFVILLCFGCIVAYKTRNAAADFKESQSIAWCVYNALLCGFLLLVLVLVLDSNIYVEDGIMMYCLLIIFTGALVFLFAPKMWIVHIRGGNTELYDLTARSSKTKTRGSKGAMKISSKESKNTTDTTNE